MKPIPETVEIATTLSDLDKGVDVLAHLQETADRVQAVVPECIGLSIGWTEQGVTFTLVASEEEIAVLDAVQYVSGGPCVEVVEQGQGLTCPDLLDEERWHSFSLASAHRGVRSTLTLPLVRHGEVVGTVNIYAALPRAFEDHVDEIAAVVGGRAADVVRNADLTFSTRLAAERSARSSMGLSEVDLAVALLAAALEIDTTTARQRLEAAAVRADVPIEELAYTIIDLWG